MAFDMNTYMLLYLQDRYSSTETDLQTLIRRYVAENPNSRNDETKKMRDLEIAAKAFTP